MANEVTLSEVDLKTGVHLFLNRLNEIVDSEPEVSDIHDAFEVYAMKKYSLGKSASDFAVGGTGDLGIDFYSHKDHVFHIGQCKIPEADYLEAHPEKPKTFGSQALSDTKDALRYLLGESTLRPNDKVKRLFALIQDHKHDPDFAVAFYIVVYGRLSPRAKDEYHQVKTEYESRRVSIRLVEMDSLVQEFLLGSSHVSEQIQFDLHTKKSEILRSPDYCYFLANAGDLFRAFVKYGWRLFDLNLRYEVRNSAVNGEIIESLSHTKTRKQFHHFNNGLIIVASNYSIRDGDSSVRLTGAQIVNGLQTVKSIYNAVTDTQVELIDLDAGCVVPVKVIKTSDAKFVADIVRSTNNQNPMAQRNLRSNNSEQKVLRKGFQLLASRWFYQLKEGEWESLTSEQAMFFEQVVGFKASEFKPVPTKKTGRVIDNQEAAKAWLAFIGFADQAGDRVTHFFSDNAVYDMAFNCRPTSEYWQRFAEASDWDKGRAEKLEPQQGDAHQYLLAYFIWQFVNAFVPSPTRYRELALDEGVEAKKITKASGSYTTPLRDQDAYLADSTTYQTWRLMANMKELLAEIVSQCLARRYGPLEAERCEEILSAFEASQYMATASIKEIAQTAAFATDLTAEQAFSRILRMLHFVSQQFFEANKQQLLSTSRMRTYLLKRDLAAQMKRLVWETNDRKTMDRVWKPEGRTFLQSLPDLPKIREPRA